MKGATAYQITTVVLSDIIFDGLEFRYAQTDASHLLITLKDGDVLVSNATIDELHEAMSALHALLSAYTATDVLIQ